MRKAVLALVVLLLGSTAAPAQPREWADKLFAEGSTHNFGSVPRGAVVSHKFTMTNIYAVPLQIIGTRASCVCASVTSSKQTLQPKETASVEVTMDTRRFTGPKKVNIFIMVGPQFTSTATLQAEVYSRADVVFNPPGEVNFGVVPLGQTPKVSIDVEYAGTLDWRITGVAEVSAPLEVKIEELYRRPGQVGYRLHITLKPDALPGTSRWEILLHTNDPASQMLPVLVQATIEASLSVSPTTVSMGNIKVGEESSRKVLVRASKPFRIVSVEGLADGMTADLPTTPASVQIVTLKCLPTKPGDLKRQLTFKTDLDSGVATSVTLEGNAIP